GRLVYVDPRMNLTGMNADEWVAPNPGTEGAVALAIANVIVNERLAPAAGMTASIRTLVNAHAPADVATKSGVPVAVIQRLAREFASQAPSLAVACGMGAQHPNAAFTAAAAHILNVVAGNVGKTVGFDNEAKWPGGGYGELKRFSDAVAGGRVGVLLIHGANPVYGAPQALNLAAN